MSKNKRWPENCVWPEPEREGEGTWWELDEVDPFLLDESCQDLMEIRDYYDKLVEEGRLNEDYSLNEDYEDYADDWDSPELLDGLEKTEDFDDPENHLKDPRDFVPEIGEDYWNNGFDIDAWEEEFSQQVALLKITPTALEKNPVVFVREVIGYEFINENLLRQAFTRRAFAIEYGLSGCSEELEFLGDSVLNAFVTKEIVVQLMEVDAVQTQAPFRAQQKGYDEGVLSRIRSQYVCKEYLAERAQTLGLDQFILYGSGEKPTENSREDMMEALIGAVALDSEWNQNALETVIDNLLCLQLTYPDSFLKATYYDLFNAWHQKHFGHVPSYEIYNLGNKRVGCAIRFQVPENDKGIHTIQRIDVDRGTRSKAREEAAFMAYCFVRQNGLWVNLKDAGLEPSLENSINQLQELYQKKYLDEAPKYEFEHWQGDEWNCNCVCGGVSGYGRGIGKTQAKKKAAYMVLIRLLKSAGIRKEGWEQEYYS